MTEEAEQTAEVPFPKSKMLLVDLDKTLLDQNYQITDKQIYSEIERVQGLGWQLGLSSDTAFEPLLAWRNRFGMNGPLVAEKGSVLFVNEKLQFNESLAAVFEQTKNTLVNYLGKQKIPYFFGDVTQLIRQDPKLSGMVDNRVALVQAYRRCSVSFYGRKIDGDGRMQIDNDLTEELVKRSVEDLSGVPFQLDVDFNKDYGIGIIAPSFVNKENGTRDLVRHLGLGTVGMIGDSTSDIVGNAALHYAVGNAKLELKSVSNYVAKSEYTAGVVEILKLIES